MSTRTYSRAWKVVSSLVFCTVLASCVTIHIYFPAEDVKRTAEEIVGDIRRDPHESQHQFKRHTLLSLWAQGIRVSLAPATAHAQSETTVSNAAIRNLQDRMRVRNAQLVPYFSAGAIGESNNGYIGTLDTSSLDLGSRAALKRLVDAENTDRRQLYTEVARALNIDTGQIGRIESIFAAEWRKSAGSGWPIQNPDGSWGRK